MKLLLGGARDKPLLMVAVVTLLPALVLGALGLTAVRGLSGTARSQAREALEQELRQRLTTRVQERARADDALFQGVLAQAVTLRETAKWYYDNPSHLPEPGYLRGGSALLETPLGHRVNLPETPVGVFVSRRADMTEAVWREVGLLSFSDPLLTAVGSSTPGAARAWVISATGVVRIFPNLRLGHEGSPVGPDYDITLDEPFQAAGPQRNPEGVPLWSAPYADPVSGEMMITAVAPLYSAEGLFRAVAGVDMALSQVLSGVLQSESAPAGYAFLLDREGRVVSAPARAWTDLGLPQARAPVPGRAVVTPLVSSSMPEVAGLAQQLQGAREPGLTAFLGPGGRNLLAYAPLPSTGWVLAMVAPAAEVDQPVATVLALIRRREVSFLAGGAVVVLLGAVAVLGMARALERYRAEAVRQAGLVGEERNRLAREIHDTIAQGLTGIVIHLESAEACLGPAPDPDAVRSLNRARELARSSLQEARRSVWNLRPAAVESRGLEDALRRLGEALRQEGLECTVAATPVAIPAAVEDAFFRVCQEALANVRRHSGATAVQIRLSPIGSEAVLVVSDNGRGFDPALVLSPRPGGGFGLWAMRERMEQAGGSMAVESQPGGTTVTARAPLTGGSNDGAGD